MISLLSLSKAISCSLLIRLNSLCGICFSTVTSIGGSEQSSNPGVSSIQSLRLLMSYSPKRTLTLESQIISLLIYTNGKLESCIGITYSFNCLDPLSGIQWAAVKTYLLLINDPPHINLFPPPRIYHSISIMYIE